MADEARRENGERGLGAELRLFKGLPEAAPDAIIVVNRLGRIHLVDVQEEKHFGYARSEICAQPIDILIPRRLEVAEHGGHTCFSLCIPRAGRRDAPCR